MLTWRQHKENNSCVCVCVWEKDLERNGIRPTWSVYKNTPTTPIGRKSLQKILFIPCVWFCFLVNRAMGKRLKVFPSPFDGGFNIKRFTTGKRVSRLSEFATSVDRISNGWEFISKLECKGRPGDSAVIWCSDLILQPTFPDNRTTGWW